MAVIGRCGVLRVLGGAMAAWPVAGRAQPSGRVRRIGVLMTLGADDPLAQAPAELFRALCECGQPRYDIAFIVDCRKPITRRHSDNG
jgi:hypothetical protein